MATINVLEGDLEGVADKLSKLLHLSQLSDARLTLLVMMQSEGLLIQLDMKYKAIMDAEWAYGMKWMKWMNMHGDANGVI
jgi:hypothetical protein